MSNDKEECIHKLTLALEALENYSWEDANPPEKGSVQKATEASIQADKAVDSISNQVFPVVLQPTQGGS